MPTASVPNVNSMYKFAAAVLGLIVLVSAANADPLPSGPAAGVRWSRNSIRIAVSASLDRPGSNIKSDSDVAGAIRRSVDSWEKAANVTFELTDSDRLSVSPSGLAGDGSSLITIAQTPENLLLFEKGLEDAPARTRVFVDRKGFVTEADIVLNPFLQFSTDGTFGTFDLESVLTHEIGHLLGLPHSSIIGSTMHEQIGRNGLYSLQNINVRTLSGQDISAVRSLYGPLPAEENCCGRINGKITMPAASKVSSLHAWAENAETGETVAEAAVAADGTFRLAGIPAGKYRVYVQDESDKATRLVAADDSIVNVNKDEASSWSARARTTTARLRTEFLGLNGQIAGAAVPMNRGRSYTVYLAGRSLDPKAVKVGSTSPFIEVDDSSIENVDYRDDLSVIAVKVSVNAKAPVGTYSLFVRAASGSKSYFAGGITVEEFEDPFSLSSALSE